jgi:hypothetical protein
MFMGILYRYLSYKSTPNEKIILGITPLALVGFCKEETKEKLDQAGDKCKEAASKSKVSIYRLPFSLLCSYFLFPFPSTGHRFF